MKLKFLLIVLGLLGLIFDAAFLVGLWHVAFKKACS